ncbi:hypothetical protein J2S43_002981 [Catenuloplanes nepalensis]|uniref:SUKH-4 immunity protein of toxin-antitoxin system n=1 Tax=Catenuloplanes nepalensis TaxID=587533 RepID=A0ABT9MSQ5_9ACTN|nr:hypothetical protein [Catenuloplanes nepalensis]MDP9794469.1 hypothetical protein [Catenuloplanes nepalensis]
MTSYGLRAVLEVQTLETTPAWPVAACEPYTFVPLGEDAGDAEIGLFMAMVSEYADVPADLLAEQEALTVSGGLRLTGGGTTIVPGCCAGLESWRDWALVLRGETPWLGHDPHVAATLGEDGIIRVRQDAGEPDSVHVDVPAAVFLDLLEGVRADLTGFLGAVRAWAGRHGIAADPLAAILDSSFQMTAPL